MIRKLLSSILLAIIFLSILVPASIPAYEKSWWDNDFSYREEIIIPIDTSLDQAKFQPIDTRFEFKNPCWAKDELEHSVRVIVEIGCNFQELECQIYDLEHTDENHIKSCNLVFLIPESADGREKYYLYYDDSTKYNPGYFDHVSVKDSFYTYEPISGYALKSNCYEILEHDYIIYEISQEGTFMGIQESSQYIGKLKEKSTEVVPKNGELYASFEFMYYPANPKKEHDYSSTSQKLVSKDIFVDGNLMVEVGIVSESKYGDLRTTGKYKYYYCPTENKRIHSHIKHETLKECTVHSDAETDGTYAVIHSGDMKSRSISDLNFGKMFPFLHFFDENNIVSEYLIDPDPEYNPNVGVTRILSYEDDQELGEKSWVCFDEGEDGISHSLIFNTNNVLKRGSEEKDGIQVKSYSYDPISMPGFEINLADIQLLRNSYERGGQIDRIIPDDLLVEFYAEFFSSQSGGYKIIEKEAEIFQELVKIKPSNEKNLNKDNNNNHDNILSVFVHNAAAFPLGAQLSTVLGFNFSHIVAELYKADDYLGTNNVGKVPMKAIPDIDDGSIFKKIASVISEIDFKNITLFKRAYFPNLEKGTYLIKIYREHPLIGKDRKFIGYKIVKVDGNTKTHLTCHPQSSAYISVIDQDDNPIEGIECKLIYKNTTISKDFTSTDGKVTLYAPCYMLRKYTLQLSYKGFTIYEKNVRFGPLKLIFPIKVSTNLELHNFRLKIIDKLGFKPSFKITPILTSEEMANPTNLIPDVYESSSGYYIFNDLVSGKYKLNIRYKSTEVEEIVDISSKDEEMEITFPIDHLIKINVFDKRGNSFDNTNLIITRETQKISFNPKSGNLYEVFLPPGEYDLNVYSNGEIIGSRQVNIMDDCCFEMITSSEPSYPAIVTILAIVIFFIIGFIFLRKKDYHTFLKFIIIIITIVAIVSPWWILNGNSNDIKMDTETALYLSPPKQITFTSSSEVSAGEFTFLPGIFVDVLNVIIILLALGCGFIILNLIFEKYHKKKLQTFSLIISNLSFIGSLSIFYIAVSELSKVGVGGFIGSGKMDIKIPGDGISLTDCSWGPSIGFYLILISIVILLIFNFYKFIRAIKK